MKNIVRGIIQKIKGTDAKKEYQEIKNIVNRESLLKFQQKYLEKLILYSYENVPYYKNIFDEINLIVNEKVNLKRFSEIPILTKDILRKHQKELISKDYMSRRWYRNYSGGSTGEPTMLIQDNLYYKWFIATNKYYYNDMLNIDESNVKKILLWGSPQDLFHNNVGFKNKIINWLTNTVILNSFKMSENDMKFYIKTINNFKPDLIRGYAGSLYELVKFAERNKLNLYKPKIIISSAEVLSNEMRVKIETLFRTKVYDFYGSRETASIAGECKNGLIHIFSFNNYMEIIDKNNNPITEVEEGKLLITSLHNYSMPMIRYAIGDMAVLGPPLCFCGNYLPCLKKISGRIEEQFIKKDGSIVIGYFFVHLLGVLLNKGFLKRFQVIQEEYNQIKIRAVLEKKLAESEKDEIEEKIRVAMGEDCIIVWDFVDNIPETRSGKYLYTQSLVNKSK